MTSYLVNPKKAAEEKKATTPAAAKITAPSKPTYTYTPPVLVEEDQKQFQNSANNNAQAQREAAAIRTAQAEALKRQQEEQARAQAEARLRAEQIAAQQRAMEQARAQQEQQRLAEAKARQDALAEQIAAQARAKAQAEEQARIEAQAQQIAAQQRAQAEANKLKQINTATVTPASPNSQIQEGLFKAEQNRQAEKNKQQQTNYQWRTYGINPSDYRYRNPVAGTVTPKEEETPFVLPGANIARNITDKIRNTASYLYSTSPQQVRAQAEAPVTYRYPMTPGLARVENVNIPAANMPANTRVPLASPLAPAVMQRVNTQNNGNRLMNTALASTQNANLVFGTKSYAERAALQNQINNLAARANVSPEAPLQSINKPKRSLTLNPSYGQVGEVVKAPYKEGGYTEAELRAMGNVEYGKYYGDKGMYEGYYLAPDGKYYPVDQGKANWALSRGMTDPSQYWLYEGYTPDKEAYRNVMGTYAGYTPSWRTTVYANASGAGPGGTWNYNPTPTPVNPSASAFGSGYSGEVIGQQRYFNPVMNWNY